MEQSSQAVEGQLERKVRAHNPERDAFEAFCCRRWGAYRDDFERHAADAETYAGQYRTGSVEFAWCAWQAARPKRAAYGAVMNVAAALAQRKPIYAFSELEDATHIGHRQFRRAYNKADEETRLLAVKLADAVRAL